MLSALNSRWRGRARRTLAAAGLLAAAGCAQASGDEPGRLDAGGVTRLAARDSSVVLLLFDPDDCLVCGANMPRWLAVRRESPQRVAILLTRPPSESEAVMFARYRIPVDGVIARGVLPRAERGGNAFVYSAGRLSASGPLANAKIQATLDRELEK